MESCIYNGVDLSERYIVAGVTRPLPTPNANYQFVPGGARNAIRSVELMPPELSFTLIAIDADEQARRDAAHELAAALLVEEPVKVAFGSDSGRYYKAVPNGALDFREFVRSGSLLVTMLCEEAAMFGETRVKRTFKPVSSTDLGFGSMELEIGGNCKTRLNLDTRIPVNRDGDGLWGVMLDNGTKMVVNMNGADKRVIVNSEDRYATVGGTLAQPTLDSDWFEVEPGKHVVSRYLGESYDMYVSWTERWL